MRSLGVRGPEQALRNLAMLGERIGSADLEALLPLMLADLQRSADPDMALNNLERFTSVLSDGTLFVHQCRERRHVLRSLITIFGASRFLSTFLILAADEGWHCCPIPRSCRASPINRSWLSA